MEADHVDERDARHVHDNRWIVGKGLLECGSKLIDRREINLPVDLQDWWLARDQLGLQQIHGQIPGLAPV
jgi:hypothetical protein